MSIQSDIDELNNINIEINRYQQLIKEYKKQKIIIENRVINFLQSQDTHGVRYNNKAVVLENKEYRNKKKKTEKFKDIASVLQSHGVNINETLIKDIINAQKGQSRTNNVLRIIDRS